ncbi:MAG: hypothetical protein R2710_10060 [Acidimicrobiales bacterium]
MAVDRPLDPARAPQGKTSPATAASSACGSPTPTGAWTTHADDERLMVPVPSTGLADRPRYRMLDEGLITDFDGYTVPTPRAVQGLDLNRNYAAGGERTSPGRATFPGANPRPSP